MSLSAGVLFTLPLAAVAQHPTLQTKTATTADKDNSDKDKEPEKPQTLSVDARLVNVPVVVRDKNGAILTNLTQADFALQVDGKAQTIRYFDRDTNLPLNLGLLIDTSPSQRNALDDERDAGVAFLDKMLVNEKDLAFVAQFARQIELLQDLTNSRPKLQKALKEVGTSNPNDRSTDVSDTDDTDRNSNDRNGNSRNRAGRSGSALYDSIFLASDEILSRQKGRKALVILTDGIDRGSKETLADAIESAQRADTTIYAIYFKGEQPRDEPNRRMGGGYPGGGGGMGYPGGYPGRYPGGYPGGYPGRYPSGGSQIPKTDGKKVLDRITRETGGRVFEVSKKQTFAEIYKQIDEELRSQYRLGFTPDKTASSSGYHQIDLSLIAGDKKKDTLQVRDGYYTGN